MPAHSLAFGLPRDQPPDYTLPGMEDPTLPENQGNKDINLCPICFEPLAGHPEADPTLPKELEVITASQRQYHRWCIAGWVVNNDTDPLTRKKMEPVERDALLKFRSTWSLVDTSRDGNIARVRELLAIPGIDVNSTNKFGQTALMLAIDNGHNVIARLLLAMPEINVNQIDRYGGASLMRAAFKGAYFIVQILLAVQGIKVNQAESEGYTALLFATAKKHTDIVQMLLKAEGINVNQANKYGKTALLFASANGHTDIVKMLLKAKGIYVNHVDNFGKTALMEASRNGHADIVDMLRSAGAYDQPKTA